jgi:penicillin-binding protein 2
MTARLATGKAVTPRLVRDAALPPDGDATVPSFPMLSVDPGHLALVRDGMNAVVNEPRGTAYAARITDPALAMAGKSGTSQVRRITQYERDHGVRKASQVPWKERDHALFVAFAPVRAPRYVCAVGVEHGGAAAGGGSAVAAPICRDVLLKAQHRDPARPRPQSEEMAETVPDRQIPGQAALSGDAGQ